jgi:predicted DNA-binding transcriptional regulator AlpA
VQTLIRSCVYFNSTEHAVRGPLLSSAHLPAVIDRLVRLNKTPWEIMRSQVTRTKIMSLQEFEHLLILLNRKQVSRTTGLSAATIDRLRKTGDFSAPKRLSLRRVAWDSRAIREWMNSRHEAT